MRPANIPLPYFDVVLEQLQLDNPNMQQVFGRHVHWGYWPQPNQADGSVKDFALAAERLCRRVCKAANIQEGDRVLDVGCGFGGTIASLNEHFQQLHLTGLNIDPRQIERANQKVLPLANNVIAFVEGDACQMPFPDHSADVVLAVECIFHFPSRAAFFKEAKRVLKPGGRLALCDFVPTPFYCWLQKTVAKWGVSISSGSFGRVDTYCTVSDYKALAQQTGFTVTTLEDITSNTLPTYPVVNQLFEQTQHSKIAKTTAMVEFISRLGLLQYWILGFQS
ncbi:MAG: methyltransferase domain-containing protein [Cyanobacteria bacterium P01_F01_bin.150]